MIASFPTLFSEESSLCIYCSADVWKMLLPSIAQALDWSNRPHWEKQEHPFSLSGQRTLILQCGDVGWQREWSIKVKGHHLSLLEGTPLAMIYDYASFSRPTCKGYSSLSRVGPCLPSGHSANAGWWSHAITIENDLSLKYLPPVEDAPSGAMLLRAAEHELEMLQHAWTLKCSPFLPVAYGRYPGEFDGQAVGFNIVAGPFGRDFRANGLLKGMLFPSESDCHLYIPSAGLRGKVAAYCGISEDDCRILEDASTVRALWLGVANELGRILRGLHSNHIYHGAPDFGNLTVASVGECSVCAALCDWEEARSLAGLQIRERRSYVLEDLAYLVHSLLLEAKNNPFFSRISSPQEVLTEVFRTYLGTSIEGSAVCASDLIKTIEQVMQRTLQGGGYDCSATIPRSLVKAFDKSSIFTSP
jgi:hypothetical protein